MKARSYLDDICARMKGEFAANRRVMGFEDYLELYSEFPRVHARNAAQYLFDCFGHFGFTQQTAPLGDRRRWNLMDVPWDNGRERLVGQEEVQEAIYRIVQNFTRQRVVNKLILLHGPNGSSKSSILACIARGLEQYSRTDEGAMYCFNWIFPKRAVSKPRLGFGGEGAGGTTEPETYANLEADEIAAVIPGDLRDHPLLLLPIDDRRSLLDKALAGEVDDGDDETFQVAECLLRGELAPRNQQIAELLYASYQGDLRKVLRHVQVQRLYLSRRFRRGIVTVEPQLHVDAGVRQLTGDRSLTSLPSILQSTTLYEPTGDLVDAHRSLIEYNDLLKRPLDSFKYLLATCEKSSVALPNQILYLDLLFFASSNDTHLSAFKEYADWPSFKGRIELVRVPYLRSYLVEREIYETQITPEVVDTHIAPHAARVAALWAVLTRLRKPKPDRYPKALRGTVAALSPVQKAELYATGRTPTGLPLEKARALRALIEQMADEERADGLYEGQIGASPREMKLVMLNAAHREEYAALTPLAVLAEITELCTQKTIYPFLQMEPEGQYGDHTAFVEACREHWLDLADDELTRAMGLVTRDQYDELFQRYLKHVSHAGRGEKLLNPITGAFDEPSYDFMEELERRFGVDKDARDFRSRVLGRIGAASQQGPVDPSDYRELFPNLFDKLEESYYAEQSATVKANATNLLMVLNDDAGRLSAAAEKQANESIARLRADFGYNDDSAKEMVATLVGERYK